MARPRKSPPPATDRFADLAKKTAILEREVMAQRAAIARLKPISQVRGRPMRADSAPQSIAKRRQSR
jgi:hypothetical protein